MLRRILARLGVRSGGNDAEGADAERAGTGADGDATVNGGSEREDEDAGGGPLRSRLDASVLFAHGIRSVSEREVEELEERAAELEDRRRELDRRDGPGRHE